MIGPGTSASPRLISKGERSPGPDGLARSLKEDVSVAPPPPCHRFVPPSGFPEDNHHMPSATIPTAVTTPPNGIGCSTASRTTLTQPLASLRFSVSTVMWLPSALRIFRQPKRVFSGPSVNQLTPGEKFLSSLWVAWIGRTKPVECIFNLFSPGECVSGEPHRRAPGARPQYRRWKSA